ncbi:hypothetical protein PoB_004394600 [Plakobranchus ocellatus]|uniref:Uncharacterized protein n=1 Tax=Plakobranchus ocellatus TaxID=259542 RepID=A0AAV4B271_9GAST|nr:hypothetical protein PoB_004394600 [Plakobranchus ocellatus]
MVNVGKIGVLLNTVLERGGFNRDITAEKGWDSEIGAEGGRTLFIFCFVCTVFHTYIAYSKSERSSLKVSCLVMSCTCSHLVRARLLDRGTLFSLSSLCFCSSLSDRWSPFK